MSDYINLSLAGLILESHGPDSGVKKRFILILNSLLRDYIYKSEIYPSLISPPLPISSVIWSAVGLCGDIPSTFTLNLEFPDQLSPLNFDLDTIYSSLFLGSNSAVEYGLTYNLSGRVLGSFYLQSPEPPSPPLPPVFYSSKSRDLSFPQDFQYPYGFSWPFEIQESEFKTWYFNIYYNGINFSGISNLPLITILS